MSEGAPTERRGEYALRGDYHRQPDESWDYYPTYLAKSAFVTRYLTALPPGTRVLDAGCGEGVFVEAFAGSLAIEGVDIEYSSAHVKSGSVTALPYPDGSFRHVLCLDVLEHLTFGEQPRAIAELRRVLEPGGELLLSVPNLAHLQSRVHFMFTGRLIRTANEVKHPGDRPGADYERLLRAAGFEILQRHGIFPTVPVLTRLVRRHPARLEPLHRWLTRLLPFPGLCFLNLFRARKLATPIRPE